MDLEAAELMGAVPMSRDEEVMEAGRLRWGTIQFGDGEAEAG
jgi:hypothetical protein